MLFKKFPEIELNKKKNSHPQSVLFLFFCFFKTGYFCIVVPAVLELTL